MDIRGSLCHHPCQLHIYIYSEVSINRYMYVYAGAHVCSGNSFYGRGGMR